MALRYITSILVLLASLLLINCGHNDVGLNGGLVGGDCRDNVDCADTCVGGGDFPGGTCTIPCRDDYDCPGTTWCAEKAGGVCLLGCTVNADCRINYVCKDVDRHGTGGKTAVCIGN